MTSFVRADPVPQLADGFEVLCRVHVPDEVEVAVLIANIRGLDRALAARAQFADVTCVVSASETHDRCNVNRMIDESLAEF